MTTAQKEKTISDDEGLDKNGKIPACVLLKLYKFVEEPKQKCQHHPLHSWKSDGF